MFLSYFNKVVPALLDDVGSTLKAIVAAEPLPYQVGVVAEGNNARFELVASGESTVLTEAATGTALATLKAVTVGYKGAKGSLKPGDFSTVAFAALELTSNLVEGNGEFVDQLKEKLGKNWDVQVKDDTITITWRRNDEEQKK